MAVKPAPGLRIGDVTGRRRPASFLDHRMAGASCPLEIMQRVIDEMHMKEVTICYGMTETSPVSVRSFVDDPVEKRVTTVGHIHQHLEAKVIDGEGAIIRVGEPGELRIRGNSVMRGYWGDEERTRENIAGGWMHSGDPATLDEHGEATPPRISGRSDRQAGSQAQNRLLATRKPILMS